MGAPDKVIFFELNEVPFKVLDAFIRKNPTSDLAELMRRSRQFVTVCEDEIELDPWISWPTLHRGVADRTHRILSLGQKLDAVDRAYPPIWRILADADLRVGVFGSIHSNHRPSSMAGYSFYVPDFFDDTVFAHPPSLEDFQRFNLMMTRRSARNVDTAIPREASMRLLRSAMSLGISLDTAAEVASQLAHERREPRVRLRRRSLQSLLMADVFARLLRNDMPHYASFYSNHVAAAMHRYWAAAFPDDYDPNRTTPEWRKAYAPEIFEALRVSSKILGKLRRIVDQRGDTLLCVASSMGQHATDHPPSQGFYTIRNIEKFMAAFNVDRDAFRQRHAMVPCTGAVVDAARVADFKAMLDRFRIGDARMVESETEVYPMSYGLHEGGFFSFYLNFDSYDGEHVGYVDNRALSFEDLGIAFFPHEDGVSVTAHHDPEGILTVYGRDTPVLSDRREQISTLEIAPALLAFFGLPAAPYMRAPSPALQDALLGARTIARHMSAA